MKKNVSRRLLCIALSLLLSVLPVITAAAADVSEGGLYESQVTMLSEEAGEGEEVFPDDGITEPDDSLNAGEFFYPQDSESISFGLEETGVGEAVFPEDSLSDEYGEDLGTPEEEELENSDSETVGEDEELEAKNPGELEFEEEEESEEGEGDDEELNASAPYLSVASTKVSVEKGGLTSINVTCYSAPKSYKVTASVAGASTVSASWGKFSGNTIPLTIKGKAAGSAYVYVRLYNSTKKTLYDSKLISVTVSAPSISVSSSSVSVRAGAAQKVTVTYGGVSGAVYVKYKTTNTKNYTCSWGSFSGNSIPLNITGKTAGSGKVTVYLYKSTGNKLLSSKTINVSVVKAASITASKSSVSLDSGDQSSVTMTCSNYSGSITVQFSTTNTSAYSLKWGEFSGSRIPLYITGNAGGSGTVTVYLKQTGTGTVLASTKIYVYVTQKQNAKVTASPSSLSIKAGASGSTTLTASGVSGTVTFRYSLSNTTVCSASWGSPTGYSMPLTIKGLSAGSSTVKVELLNSSGTLLAQTSISVTVSKTSSGPVLTASRSSLSITPSGCGTVSFTFSNTTGYVYYKYSTTNTSAYSCAWEGWVGTTNTLNITGKAAGSGTVTVYLCQSADDKVLTSASVRVTVSSSGDEGGEGSAISSVNQVSYQFYNFSFSATLALCQKMFGNTSYANVVYNKHPGNGGNCFGFATTSGLFYVPGNGVNVSSFHSGISYAKDLLRDDKNYSFGLTTQEFIQCMQMTQYSTDQNNNYIWKESDLKKLVDIVKENTAKGRPVEVSVWGILDGRSSGHALLAYGVQNSSSTQTKLLIYDSNKPLKTSYLTLYKNSAGEYTGWDYNISGSTYWGTNYANATIAYNTYDEYLSWWNKRGSLKGSGLSYMAANSGNFIVCDMEDKEIARVENGVLYTENEDVRKIEELGIVEGEQPIERETMLFLPTDLYTVKNGEDTDSFKVTLADENMAVEVDTAADTVTLCADDSENLAQALIEDGKDDDYKISLYSSTSGEIEEITLTGQGEEDSISAFIDDDGLFTNMAEAAVSEKVIDEGEDFGEALEIRGLEASYEYTGAPILPDFSVYYGSRELTEKTDYTVTLSNNKNIGTAKLVIRLKGDYEGEKTTEFDITQGNIAGINAGASDLTVKYNGKKQTPAPVLLYYGKKLKMGTDFYVKEYEEKKDDPEAFQGESGQDTTYELTLSGKGNYTGERTVRLTIRGKDGGDGAVPVDMSKVRASKIPDQIYTGKAFTLSTLLDSAGKGYSPEITYTAKGTTYTLTEGKDFEVARVINAVKTGTATLVLKGLSAASEGDEYSFNGEKSIKFKITARPITDPQILVNDGRSISAEYEKGGASAGLTVSYNGTLLKEGTDYSVKYTNNNKITTGAGIILTGKGNYRDKKTIPLEVTQRKFSKDNGITVLACDQKEGKKEGQYTTTIRLTDRNGKVLKAGTDYEKKISYYDSEGKLMDQTSFPKEGEVITAVITGKGPYSADEIRAAYRIIPEGKDISKADIRLKDHIFTGNAVMITRADQFSSLKLGSEELGFGRDIEVVSGSYINNVKRGTAKVTLHGIGEYGGYKTVSFKIVSRTAK
ncbi:MAG: hypothetical protein IJT16_13265 [Lachnospiraceae bacterium]|nr:hypothetical protein [Lachnospiraceae bacterium]